MHTRRLAVIALAASAATSGSLAFASSVPQPPGQRELGRTCSATLASLQTVTAEAASHQVKAIVSQLTVVTPGDLNAQLAFNRAGGSIRVAQDRSSFGVGCARTAGHGRGLGPGRSRTVSTLHERFRTPGHYTLTFKLNPTGRAILAQLGAAQRAYHTRHPNGHRPPGIAYAVALQFETDG